MATSKVNISINPETMDALKQEKIRLYQELGFSPSYSQVIQHLLKQAELSTKRIDEVVEMLTDGGDDDRSE